MKKVIALMLLTAVLLTGCSGAAKPTIAPQTAQEAIDLLLENNAQYIANEKNSGDLTQERRTDTAENGQSPYAVVVTCSDFRVPAEHIFNAGIGELFVIRTAGNVIGDYELGSVEYGVEHLHAKLVVVLGHTQCGAVDAALNGGAHGHIQDIANEIAACLPEGCDPRQAEMLNVQNSLEQIGTSEMLQDLVANEGVVITGAIYDIDSGKVEFLN